VGSRVHAGNAHRVLAEVISAGEVTPEQLQIADEHFNHALEILAGMKNDLELARVYRSFAVFCERTGRMDDAAALRRSAEDIYTRLRGAAGA
jgi:lysyl-tRNA synthetase class I